MTQIIWHHPDESLNALLGTECAPAVFDYIKKMALYKPKKPENVLIELLQDGPRSAQALRGQSGMSVDIFKYQIIVLIRTGQIITQPVHPNKRGKSLIRCFALPMHKDRLKVLVEQMEATNPKPQFRPKVDSDPRVHITVGHKKVLVYLSEPRTTGQIADYLGASSKGVSRQLSSMSKATMHRPQLIKTVKYEGKRPVWMRAVDLDKLLGAAHGQQA